MNTTFERLTCEKYRVEINLFDLFHLEKSGDLKTKKSSDVLLSNICRNVFKIFVLVHKLGAHLTGVMLLYRGRCCSRRR